MSVDALTREARDAFESYAEPPERPPFLTYAALATVFNTAFAGALLGARRSGRLRERVESRDVVLIGVASHKLSRLLAKDKGVWTSGAFHAGLLFAPRATRVVASTLTALTLSDVLQIAYKAADDHSLGGS